MAAAAPPIAAHSVTLAALAAPSVPHVFNRVTLVGKDNTLDYVAAPSNCLAVKCFTQLGWVDSSAVRANTMAAPLLLARTPRGPAGLSYDAVYPYL